MTARLIDHMTGEPLGVYEIAYAIEGGVNAGDLGMCPVPGQLWERIGEHHA